MIRCCLCREPFRATMLTGLLPNAVRCVDRDACRERVRSIVAAHVALGEV